MENIFGEQFRAYKLRTPRLIPRPSLYVAAPTVEVRLRPLRTEAKRLIIASLMLILVFGLPYFQATAGGRDTSCGYDTIPHGG